MNPLCKSIEFILLALTQVPLNSRVKYRVILKYCAKILAPNSDLFNEWKWRAEYSYFLMDSCSLLCE